MELSTLQDTLICVLDMMRVTTRVVIRNVSVAYLDVYCDTYHETDAVSRLHSIALSRNYPVRLVVWYFAWHEEMRRCCQLT